MNDNALIEYLKQSDMPNVNFEELWFLMERQTALYTNLNSSSVPKETAESLLESVLFCIKTAYKFGNRKPDSTYNMFLNGQRILYAKQQQGLKLQKFAESIHLKIKDNVIYNEALQETRQFFKWYDIRFKAHEIPCMIDYPFVIPVHDGLKGIDYITQWLKQIVWEDLLCRPFEIAAVNSFLQRQPKKGINIFEHIYACLMGKALLLKKIDLAPFTKNDINQLQKTIDFNDIEKLEQQLTKSCSYMCNNICMLYTKYIDEKTNWYSLSEQNKYYFAHVKSFAHVLKNTNAANLKNVFA